MPSASLSVFAKCRGISLRRSIYTLTAAERPRQCSLEYAKTKLLRTRRATNVLRAEGLLPATHSTATALLAIARATGSLSTRRQRHPASNRHLSDATKFH